VDVRAQILHANLVLTLLKGCVAVRAITALCVHGMSCVCVHGMFCLALQLQAVTEERKRAETIDCKYLFKVNRLVFQVKEQVGISRIKFQHLKKNNRLVFQVTNKLVGIRGEHARLILLVNSRPNVMRCKHTCYGNAAI